jgi:ABC-type glycerol-3-phosphate transport system permease component
MARVLERTAPMGVAVTTPRRRRDWSSFTAHAILIASVAVLAFPLYYAIVISTQTAS